MRTLLCLAVLGAAFPARPTVAQEEIALRLVDRADGQAVEAMFVALVDAGGAEVARAARDSAGRFRLRAPTGSYRLRVERIGFHLPEVPSVSVGPDAPAARTLRVTQVPVRLDTLATTTNTLCPAGQPLETGAAVLWREARKALVAAVWTDNDDGYDYRATLFDRQVDPTSERVLRERASVADARPVSPFAAVATDPTVGDPYVEVSDDGLATYAAPNPTALVNEAFVETHCFSVRRDPVRHAGLVGLAFRPSIGSTSPDIAGTMWLDERTAVLRTVAFNFVVAETGPDDTRFGGELGFASQDGIRWFVNAWHLVWPSRAGLAGTGGDPDAVVKRQMGGRLVAVTGRDGGAVYSDQTATVLRGAVFDSTTMQPLAGAVVALAGTDQWASTDALGEFFMAGPLHGTYDVVFGHPRLDSLGFLSPPTTVSLESGGLASLDLAVPRLLNILAARCPLPTLTNDRRVLLGLVRDTETGAPVAGAEVVVSWQSIPQHLRRFAVDDREARANTDQLGTYAVCGVPLEHNLIVHAAGDSAMSDFIPVTFEPTQVRMGRDSLVLSDLAVARLDLTLIPQARRTASIQGRVTNLVSSHPVDGAQVQIVGTALTVATDTAGTFRFTGVPAGSHRITARRIGYRRVRHELDVQDGQAIAIADGALAMPVGATELAPIVVEADALPLARRHLRGFYDRRETGLGHFVTREEFDEWSPTIPSDILRHIPGIRVTPNIAYGVSGDSRRYLITSPRGISLGGCPVLYFLDGSFFGTSADQESDLDNILAVSNIQAIEVYSSAAQVPARFNRAGASCGVVVIWTG